MFSKIIPTLQIDVQNDRTSLGIQESLLLQQRYYSLSQLDQANESIDNKAIMLIQSSSLIFALIGALQFPKIVYDPTIPVLVAIVASFLAFFTMVYFLMKVWFPDDYQLPGTNDWVKLHEEYLWVSSKDSFTQILDDCVETYGRLKHLNKSKSKKLTIAVYLFLLQISGLLFVSLFS